MSAVEPLPAATVVVARARDAAFDVLMLRRNSKHAFGGMWVFPGGKVDPHDVDPTAPHDDEMAARRAAVREASEEAGILLDASALVTISHWTPPPEAPRRFTTWFFATEAPPACDVAVDGDEIQEHVWIEPADALRRAGRHDIEVAAPTWMTLTAMSPFSEFRAFLEEARRQEPLRFATRLARAGHDPVALWDRDAGYVDGDLERPGPRHRLYMGRGPWRYEGRE